MVAGKIYQYNQHQLSVDQQINLLKQQRLNFKDEKFAKHLLNHISMFRLRSYFRPLQVGISRMFKSGVTFEDVYRLYEFDSELRRIVNAELEKIEVSIRTQLSYIVTDLTGDSFWFTQQANFCSQNFAQDVCDKLIVELKRNDDDEISVFRKRYRDPFPPSWVVMEVSSFGTLYYMYKNLSNIQCKRDVANYYRLPYVVMESWLRALVYVRNICAHHNRLWNKVFRISPLIVHRPGVKFLNNAAPPNRIYYVLSIILYFMKIVDSGNSFASKVKNLLAKYPEVDIRAMGFPYGWEKELLWQ